MRAAAARPLTSADVTGDRPSSPGKLAARADPANARRQFELDPAVAGAVHRVVLVHAAQLGRNRVEVGDQVIPGQVEMHGEVGRQLAVAAAGQQLSAAPDAAVAVQRHHHIDMVEELRERRRLIGLENRAEAR